MNRIKKDQLVKIISGGHKGKIGKVIKVSNQTSREAKPSTTSRAKRSGAPRTGAVVWVEGVNMKVRHIAPNRLNPRGGKKDVHLPIDISNIAIIHDGKEDISKVAFKITDAGKQRIVKKTGKELK